MINGVFEQKITNLSYDVLFKNLKAAIANTKFKLIVQRYT